MVSQRQYALTDVLVNHDGGYVDVEQELRALALSGSARCRPLGEQGLLFSSGTDSLVEVFTATKRIQCTRALAARYGFQPEEEL